MFHEHIILSTAYFPPIEYFVHISQSIKVSLEMHENFNKQSYRNRCYISGANQVMQLSIPVSKGIRSIREVRISYHYNWSRIHWRSIESYYNSSPFFLYYRDELELFFNRKYNLLFDLNNDILQKMIELCGLPTIIQYTNDFQSDYENAADLRNTIHPKVSNTMKNYSVNFPTYHQVFETRFGFIPNMSILDLLFNEGPRTLDYLLSCRISQ